nr:uncharacterized protein LOC122272199 [Parasteatoda tepidariorum]
MDFLKLVDILAYLERDEKSRSITEGEKIINSNHILTCGVVKQPLPRKRIIYAVCLRSTKLNSSPYVIEGALFQRMSGNGYGISQFNCSCPAGAVCKHVAAVLLHAVSSLEEISSTDKSYYWDKQKSSLKKYDIVPLQDFCCGSQKKDYAVSLSEDVLGSYESKILEACPNSALASLLCNYNELFLSCLLLCFRNVAEKENLEESAVLEKVFSTSLAIINIPNLDDVTAKFFQEKVCLTKQEVRNLALQKQGSNSWICERKKRITGSTCYSLFTYSRNKNPDWKKKIASATEDVFSGNAYTFHGQEMEERARNIFSCDQNVQVFCFGLIVLEQMPWFGYSPDGLYFEDGNLILLEIKCPFKMRL